MADRKLTEAQRAYEAKRAAKAGMSLEKWLTEKEKRAAAVLRKGDPDSGGILCVMRGRGGVQVLSQIRDAEGRPAWLRATGPGAVDQETADSYVARQVQRDPDLWVVEFDAPDLQPPFEARIV